MRQENPIANALLAKMSVKAECLRLLASLKLDPARTKLIGGFVDSSLKLTSQELKQYERALEKFTPEEKKETVEIVTSWEEKGITQAIMIGRTEGLTQGKEALVTRQLRRQLGTLAADQMARLDRLSPEQLDDLGEALLDFQAASDLEQWFARHGSQ